MELLLARHLWGVGLLILLAGVFLVWQWREFEADKTAARRVLERQAETLFHAVVGAIRSHRRLGAFFDQQIQTVLDELVESEDVLGAAIYDGSDKIILHAGQLSSSPESIGEGLAREGFFFKGQFEIPALPPGGPGTGGGRGFGWGRWFREAPPETPPSLFAGGGRFSALLILDRSDYDARVRRSLVNRLMVVTMGLLSLALVGVAWGFAVRAVKAEHKQRLAEVLARHYEELGQAASGLAHETRNPLGLIRGWAQRLLQSHDVASPIAKEAALIMEECDRISARLTQFLAFAKPSRPKLEPLDPDAIIAELKELLGPDCEAKRVRCIHTPSGKSLTLMADTDLFRQAVFNLLHNAVKFAPPGTEIHIRTQLDGSRCVLEVADQGPGVPPEHVGKLFTPYFTTDPRGTGLGLAIVRRVAEAHGWNVEYEPGPQGGAIFRLIIPWYKEQV